MSLKCVWGCGSGLADWGWPEGCMDHTSQPSKEGLCQTAREGLRPRESIWSQPQDLIFTIWGWCVYVGFITWLHQLTLGQFSAVCAVAGMGITTFKPKGTVLTWKRVEYPLKVWDELLVQVEVLQAKFTCEGRVDWQRDWCSISNDAKVVICYGEERGESNLPVDLCSTMATIFV